MRLLVIALIASLSTAAADARPRRAPQAHKRDKTKKRQARHVAIRSEPRPSFEPHPIDPYADDADDGDTNDVKAEYDAPRKRDGGPQSFGAPWAGRLEHPTKLHLGDGTYIRRPWRAYGTRSTVAFTTQVIEETLADHPEAHVLAVGDISAEHGGTVTDHRSHQSGRDIDLGLFYKTKPPGYPNDFIDGTEANLDCATMWTMISKFAGTASQDGGVWAIFLDFDVQGILYRWAKRHGISEDKLDRIFQYPHGRGAPAGIVRHYRNHAHHIHVRFKCTKAEAAAGCSY